MNEDFGYIEPREFTMELTKTKEGRYILTDESFLELRKSIFVNEYSSNDAATRNGNKTTDSGSKSDSSSSSSSDKSKI